MQAPICRVDLAEKDRSRGIATMENRCTERNRASDVDKDVETDGGGISEKGKGAGIEGIIDSDDKWTIEQS